MGFSSFYCQFYVYTQYIINRGLDNIELVFLTLIIMSLCSYCIITNCCIGIKIRHPQPINTHNFAVFNIQSFSKLRKDVIYPISFLFLMSVSVCILSININLHQRARLNRLILCELSQGSDLIYVCNWAYRKRLSLILRKETALPAPVNIRIIIERDAQLR